MQLSRLSDNRHPRIGFIVSDLRVWKQAEVARYLALKPGIEVEIMAVQTSVGAPDARETARQAVLDFAATEGITVVAPPPGVPLGSEITTRGWDAVFFENQNMLVSNPFEIGSLPRSLLKIYIPYAFRIDSNENYHFMGDFVEEMDIHFVETAEHASMAREAVLSNTVSCQPVGFPPLAALARAPRQPTLRPTLLYCPHWTIPGTQDSGLDWGTFHIYGPEIQALASVFSDKIEVIFRPHPLLEGHLRSKVWSDRDVDHIFAFWSEAENCMISNGPFEEDIKRADLILHDCGSFMAEALVGDCMAGYLSLGPLDAKTLEARYNRIGQEAFACHEPVDSIAALHGIVEALAEGRAASDPARAAARATFRARHLDPYPDPAAAIFATLFPARAEVPHAATAIMGPSI